MAMDLQELAIATVEEMSKEAAAEPAEVAAPEPAAEVAETPAPESVEKTEETPAEARARDERGRFAKATEKATTEPASAPEAKAGAADSPSPAAPATPKPAEAVQTSTATPAAPPSWRAMGRESWAKIPAEAQSEIWRREREATTALSENAEARKGWDSFRQVVAPFEHIIRSQGADPVQAAGKLIAERVALYTAPPQTRAKILADLFTQSGVTVDQFAAELKGEAAPAGGPQNYDPNTPPPWFHSWQQQQERARFEAETARYAADIAAFAKTHEFMDQERYGDSAKRLMATMAALMPVHGVRVLSDDLYNRAVAADPEFAQIAAQRKAAEAARASQQAAARTARAASSVKPEPVGQAPGRSSGKKQSLESIIEEARSEASADR